MIFFINIHDPKTFRLFKTDIEDGNRDIGMTVKMFVEHLLIIHLVNMITRKNENIFRFIGIKKLEILIDSVRSASKPIVTFFGLAWRENNSMRTHAIEAPLFAVAYIG